MRKLSILVIIIFCIGVLIACEPKKIIYKQGAYEGKGNGHHGPIVVQVATDEYSILEIKILEQQETPVLSDIVYEKIPERILKKNSINVDVVAGATFTSNGLLEAVEDAVNKAKIEETK